MLSILNSPIHQPFHRVSHEKLPAHYISHVCCPFQRSENKLDGVGPVDNRLSTD